jgi:hypothetical protein
VVYIQVGGSVTAQILASGCVVSGNTLRGDCSTEQISPLAGISLAMTQNAKVTGNNLDTFHGKCIYIDTGANYQPVFSGNSALDVPNFVSLTTQNYGRIYGAAYANWTAIHNTPQFTGNTVRLKGPWNWNPGKYGPWPAILFAYILDRDLDMNQQWFKGVTFKDNSIDLAGYAQTTNLGGWWPPSGSFQSGQPAGPVPDEPVISQVFFFSNSSSGVGPLLIAGLLFFGISFGGKRR